MALGASVFTCTGGEDFHFAQREATLDADHLHEDVLADEDFGALEEFRLGVTCYRPYIEV